jgi:hypothetical protein
MSYAASQTTTAIHTVLPVSPSASLCLFFLLAVLLNALAASELFACPETEGAVGACWIPSDGPAWARDDLFGIKSVAIVLLGFSTSVLWSITGETLLMWMASLSTSLPFQVVPPCQTRDQADPNFRKLRNAASRTL